MISFFFIAEILKTNGFQTLLNYPDDFRFDLVVNDFTAGACLLGFLHKFKYPPLLSVSAFSNPPFSNALVGGHHYVAYVPHYNLVHRGDMNFIQRTYNLMVHLSEL